MDAAITTAPTTEELNAVAVRQIIESAGRMAKGECENTRRRIGNAAAIVIHAFTSEDEEYRQAIESLTEALNL